MPGVTYSRQVQFTAHGPVVINVMTAPKPGGLYSLKPVLANGTILGRQRVTAMQKAISSTTTVAGVNGDLFNWKDGHPSGLRPAGRRHQEPADQDALEHRHLVDRNAERRAGRALRLLAGARQQADGVGEPDAEGRRLDALHAGVGCEDARSWPASTEAVFDEFPPATSGGELDGTVTAQATGGGTPIPPNGAVLLSVGTQAPKLAAEATPGTPRSHPARPDARLAVGRDRGRARRRACDRPERQGGLHRGRGLSSFAARSAGSAHRRGAAQGREDRAGRRRRAAERLQRRPDELRARPGARPAGRRHRLGPGRRRLDDDGVRRQAAEPALRQGRRASGQGDARRHVRRRVRATAHAPRDLAER